MVESGVELEIYPEYKKKKNRSILVHRRFYSPSRNAPVNNSRQVLDPRIKLVQAAGPTYVFAIENTAAMNLQVGDTTYESLIHSVMH